MLRGQTIVEVKHAGARGSADPPGEISQQLGRTDHVGAAVEIENAAIAACLANRDANRIDPAAVDRGRPRSRRRAGNKGLEAFWPAANRRQGGWPASLMLLGKAAPIAGARPAG